MYLNYCIKKNIDINRLMIYICGDIINFDNIIKLLLKCDNFYPYDDDNHAIRCSSMNGY